MNLFSFFKSEKAPSLNYYIAFFLFSALSCLCIFFFSQYQKLTILFIPLFILFLPLLFIYPQFLVFMLFASFYWEYHLLDKKYLFVAWAHVLFMLAMIGFLSKYLFNKKRPEIAISPSLLTLLLLFWGNALLSFLLNFNRHESYEVFVSSVYVCNFAILIFAFIFFSSTDMKEWKNKIILFIFFLSFLEFPFVVFQVMKVGGNYMSSYRDITGTFGAHHSQLANMMTFPLGFALAKLLDKPKLKYILLLGLLSFISFYAILYSGSRSNIIGIAGAIFVLALLKIKFKPIHFLYISLFSIGLFLLIRFSPLRHLITGTIHSSDTGSLDLSSLFRLVIWKDCWSYYWSSGVIGKLFGVGMANLMTIRFPEIIIDSKFVGGAHNIFLHVLLETGFVGFVVFMAFYITVLTKLFRQSKYDNLALAYFFITLSLLLSGFTQEIFWFQPVFGCLWLYHTCLLALVLDNKKATSLQTHP